MKSLFERNRLGSAALLLCSVAVLAAPSSAQWEGDGKGPGPDDIPEGYMLYQGDILLPLDFWEQESTFTSNIWPAVIPYEWDSNVTSANQALMLAAMSEIETTANVFFVPLAGHSNYLHIQNSAFNSSAVGRQGGSQTINIFNWNVRFIMVHELMHALGFWHEQSRTDRDAFVQINWANISQTACGGPCDPNFQIETGSAHWGPYDFDSVMHYSEGAFSSNGMDTITVLPPFSGEWQDAIGQRTHMSDFDKLTMSFIYRDFDWRFVRSPSSITLGTFFLPFDQWTVAYTNVPSGGNVIFLDPSPSTYSAVGIYTKAMTIEATLAPITLGS